MKKFISLAIIICLISCNKSSPTINSAPASFTKYFKGKLNGVSFYDSTLAKVITSTPPDDLNLIGYHAFGGISLHLGPFNYSTGERLLDNSSQIAIGNNGAFYYAGSIVAGTPIQGSGKINILEINNDYIRGSFDCIAPSDTSMNGPLPPQIITEGEFKLKRK